MQVLVTGGAGYIGSHTAKELALAGHEPVAVDNLRRGHRWAVRWGPLVETDLSDRESLHATFQKYQPSAVIHFAAFAYVGESMQSPAEYFRNNVVNTLNLLDCMKANGVGQIVFSSTCATYGNPQHIPITEDHPQVPVNPYGESKLMVERLLRWYGKVYGLSWMALRYFNAAGADPEGDLGEAHDPETHLIPRALAAAQGDLGHLEMYGTDYPTPDGTPVRDYIHVTDLASAHLKALLVLASGGSSGACNLGTGRGHSVREVIAMIEQHTRKRVPLKECERREGDPPILVADPSRARKELGWEPRHSTLQEIVATSWKWYSNHRNDMPK